MADSCSDSEEDRERSLSRREVDKLIDAVINPSTASKVRVKGLKPCVAPAATVATELNRQLLNFELKMRGCMPRSRNWKSS